MIEMTATEVSRNFSEVSNRVAGGEEITVTKGGRPLLVMKRAEPESREWMSGAEFLRLLRQGPSLDPDFAKDLERIRAENDARPERATPLQWD
jgi:prevent-host-death family protein